MSSPLPSKHYLVTGGCGFIGSHLADLLVAQGHKVTILDDLSTGKKENSPPQASLIIGDAADYSTVEQAFSGIDGCFHLAAIASVERSVREWTHTHRANLTATVNILQAASRLPSRTPVVYASSAAIYGDCPIVPIAETAPTQPLTAYGADKRGCEMHAHVAWSVHGVPNMGLRPFNIYGPRQDASSPYSGVISIFAQRIRQGQPITIYGDGEQVRDFVYVSDAARTFAAAMAQLHAKPGCSILNLCTGRATSINQLAAGIACIAGQPLQAQYAPARPGDIRISIGDPARLRAQLGLTLDITLAEGLHRLMNGVLPERRVTDYSEDIGNTLGLKGLSTGSTLQASVSKDPKP